MNQKYYVVNAVIIKANQLMVNFLNAMIVILIYAFYANQSMIQNIK